MRELKTRNVNSKYFRIFNTTRSEDLLGSITKFKCYSVVFFFFFFFFFSFILHFNSQNLNYSSEINYKPTFVGCVNLTKFCLGVLRSFDSKVLTMISLKIRKSGFVKFKKKEMLNLGT